MKDTELVSKLALDLIGGERNPAHKAVCEVIEKEFRARSKLASMCETVMRCVLALEGLPLVSVGESESVAQIAETCKKLRAAVLAAT